MPRFVNDDGHLGARLAQLASAVNSTTPDDHSGVCVEACHRIARLGSALRVLIDGYYSDDESLPTLEQWDDARALVQSKS